jgi:hypothetical protein
MIQCMKTCFDLTNSNAMIFELQMRNNTELCSIKKKSTLFFKQKKGSKKEGEQRPCRYKYYLCMSHLHVVWSTLIACTLFGGNPCYIASGSLESFISICSSSSSSRTEVTPSGPARLPVPIIST